MDAPLSGIGNACVDLACFIVKNRVSFTKRESIDHIVFFFTRVGMRLSLGIFVWGRRGGLTLIFLFFKDGNLINRVQV